MLRGCERPDKEKWVSCFMSTTRSTLVGLYPFTRGDPEVMGLLL